MIENPHVGRGRRYGLLPRPVSIRNDEVVYELHREIELHLSGLVPGRAEGNMLLFVTFVGYQTEIIGWGQQDCVLVPDDDGDIVVRLLRQTDDLRGFCSVLAWILLGAPSEVPLQLAK